ncbi:MAG: cbb3-type cytochrome c oxidase subunit 3 [Pseudomonadota bacterium]
MDWDYQSMRTFADSWGLLYMVILFVGAVIWILRPGAKAGCDDAAQIPFKEDK